MFDRANQKARSGDLERASMKRWRRPTLPRPRDRSTIDADRLNDRVRDGNGCGPVALVASISGGWGKGPGAWGVIPRPQAQSPRPEIPTSAWFHDVGDLTEQSTAERSSLTGN